MASIAAWRSGPPPSLSLSLSLLEAHWVAWLPMRLLFAFLVYAPPRAIGEFGGDVDNWEWPRHTGDFTFFRAYVAPDGSVRDHDKDNVPFQPAHFLKTATKPIQEGDLAIIMGYPGSTQRYKTSAGVATQEGYVYPARLRVLTKAIDVLAAAGATSEEMALKVVSKKKSLANVQKNAAGMIFGLKNNAVVARKLREEAQLAAASPENAALLKEMLADAEREAAVIEKDTNMWFVAMLRDNVKLFDILMQASGAVASGGKIRRAQWSRWRLRDKQDSPGYLAFFRHESCLSQDTKDHYREGIDLSFGELGEPVRTA